MKSGCKLTVALVLVLAIAIYCAVLVTISNFEHGGVITIDTFIGAGVGLIGVCATIMVGLQIWNHIEFKEVKDKIKCLDLVKDEVKADKKIIEQSTQNAFLIFDELLMELALKADTDEETISKIIFSLKLLSSIPNYTDEYNVVFLKLLHLENAVIRCENITDRSLIDLFNDIRIPTNISGYQQSMAKYYKIYTMINKK